jgi:hypothetical protein
MKIVDRCSSTRKPKYLNGRQSEIGPCREKQLKMKLLGPNPNPPERSPFTAFEDSNYYLYRMFPITASSAFSFCLVEEENPYKINTQRETVRERERDCSRVNCNRE